MSAATSSRTRTLVFAWAPAAAYMALIFTVSSMQIDLPVIASIPLRDKAIHFVEYGVLGFLCAHAILLTWPRRPRTAVSGWSCRTPRAA